jgi:hypothetical protein
MERVIGRAAGPVYGQLGPLTEIGWKPLPEWAGTCREVVVTRDDGKQHRAFFRFL